MDKLLCPQSAKKPAPRKCGAGFLWEEFRAKAYRR